MLLIVTALPFEAKPVIQGLRLAQIASPGGSRLYSTADEAVFLGVTGIGAERTNKRLESLSTWFSRRSHRPGRLLNLGLAGTNHPEWKAGRFFPIHQCRAVKSSDTLSIQPAMEELEPVPLITVDEPWKGGFLSNDQVLVDMEGYPLFRSAMDYFQLPVSQIHGIKMVSDHGSREQIDWHSMARMWDEGVTRLLPPLLQSWS